MGGSAGSLVCGQDTCPPGRGAGWAGVGCPGRAAPTRERVPDEALLFPATLKTEAPGGPDGHPEHLCVGRGQVHCFRDAGI